MMAYLKRSLLFALLLTPSFVFGATSFSADFQEIADTINPITNKNGERGYSQYINTFGPVTLTASGYDYYNNNTYYAYLDAGKAGLGVCKVLTGSNQCNPSSDDNTTENEVLQLEFSQQVTLEEILFRNANHGETYRSGADFSVSIDGGNFVDYTLKYLFDTPLTGSLFAFYGDITGDGDQFYIDSLGGTISAVPVPPAVLLFGSGLLALAGLRKKRATSC